MVAPNFTPGLGRLTTDVYDFRKHLDGYISFRHTAPQIDLSPAIVVNGSSKSTVQTCLEAINALVPQIIPNATTGAVGLVQISGDINGLGSSATNIKVGGLQGRPISTLSPSTNDVLGWNGSAWAPTNITVSSPTFTSLTVSGTSTLSNLLVNGTSISLTSSTDIAITTTTGSDINLTAADDIHLTATDDIFITANGIDSIIALSATNGITFASASTFSQNVSLNGNLTTVGNDFSDILTVNSFTTFNNDIIFQGSSASFSGIISFTGSARITNNGVVANNANQTINIRQYKYIIIPAGTTGPHTYTLNNTSTVDGDWFKISNLTTFTHTLAGAVVGSIAPNSFLEYTRVGGLWYPVGF